VNDHERVHIDGLIHEACNLLCETAVHRCFGAANALRQLREDPNGNGVWLDKFTPMFLSEHALDTVAGACTILEACERRPMPAITETTIGDALKEAAAATFGEMVRRKADEALELAAMHEGVAT
jgi:hypothetical protein